MENHIMVITNQDLKNILYKLHLNDLIEQYEQEDKKYHNLDHITYCVNKLMDYHHVDDFYNARYVQDYEFFINFFAIIFHDVGYDVDNPQGHELQSVEYFSHYVVRNSCFLRDIGVLQYTGDIIEQIISTEHKKDSLKTVVSDIDLLILAETSTVYDQYAENVRKENQHLFSHISDYKKARLQFLEKIQQRAKQKELFAYFPDAHKKVIENTNREMNTLSS